MASFVQRRVSLKIVLATGAFTDGESDTVELIGYRVMCEIDEPGGKQLASAHIHVSGLSQELMQRLTVITWQSLASTLSRNEITITADDVVVFTGDIINAMPDYRNAPDVVFVISAQAGAINKHKPTSAESYPGPVKVSVILQSIADQLGCTLENNGVDSTVTDMYLANTPVEKLRKLSQAAGFDYYYIPPILAVCPRGKPRSGADAPLINVDSGLVGWPTIDKWGVTFVTLYNPAITHGGRIKIESGFKPANGEYFVATMKHRLESERPGGAWYSTVLCNTIHTDIRL